MQRRKFIQQTALAMTGIYLSKFTFANTADFPVVRTPLAQRKFTSTAVEQTIQKIKSSIGNKEIAWLFENCYPNTLDTTVDFEMKDGRPDTYVITGDIDAMWLRDSTAQVWPYLPLMNEDKQLQQLIKGVINRQVHCILKDPYANAFYKDETRISEWKNSDLTDMKPGIHERKWEIDSLCYPIRLSHGYWKATGDISVFDEQWKAAVMLVIKTFKEQQRLSYKGPYSFQRTTAWATDGVPLGGYGYPTKKVGLIHSMFRPSDDATIYPFLIPSNLFAAVALRYIIELVSKIGNIKNKIDGDIINEAMALLKVLGDALQQHASFKHEKFGEVYAYETDSFGNCTFMDDANVPSLLSLPYLGVVKNTDSIYLNTRKHLLSDDNPFYFKGKAAEGIGGPHAGLDYIWPLSIIMRAITSNDDNEIKMCFDTLQKTHAGTGFMHESFNKDDAAKFTRKWFAWVNTLFGELVLKVYKERPHLLN